MRRALPAEPWDGQRVGLLSPVGSGLTFLRWTILLVSQVWHRKRKRGPLLLASDPGPSWVTNHPGCLPRRWVGREMVSHGACICGKPS